MSSQMQFSGASRKWLALCNIDGFRPKWFAESFRFYYLPKLYTCFNIHLHQDIFHSLFIVQGLIMLTFTQMMIYAMILQCNLCTRMYIGIHRDIKVLGMELPGMRKEEIHVSEMPTILIYFQGGLVWESGRFLSNVYNSMGVASPKFREALKFVRWFTQKSYNFQGASLILREAWHLWDILMLWREEYEGGYYLWKYMISPIPKSWVYIKCVSW